MNIAITVVTHNRLEYTKKCIERLLADPSEAFDLYLWDNASEDETGEYLKSIKDPRVVEVIVNKENLGQTGAMNYVWSRTKAELVGKLDNDCLTAPGWTRTIGQAHRDVAEFGAVACWHYPLDEFDEPAARKAGKVQDFGAHKIFRHPWVCGSGFLMKRSTYAEHGQWQAGADVGTTDYFLSMAMKGYVNGWYYPLILQEHMDDPRSVHSMVKDDDSVKKMYDITYTLRVQKIHDMKARWNRRPVVLKNLNSGPWEAKYYVGWRRRWSNVKKKMLKLAGR